MTKEFEPWKIREEAILFNFKRVQRRFANKNVVSLTCYPDTETFSLWLMPYDFEGSHYTDWRKYMLKPYIKDELAEHKILTYIHDNELLEKVSNETLIFWFGMCAGYIQYHICLEQFLHCMKIYKLEGFSGKPKPSILEEYIGEEEVTETKELVAA